jgi:hypothetical protein
MDAFIIPKTMAYVFLSTSSPTTLHFQAPVEFMQAGKGSDFDVAFSKNRRSLVIRPVGTFSEPKNMVVISEEMNFHFKLINMESQQHDFVYIHKGKANSTYVKKFENDLVKIHEGDSSLYIVNKLPTAIEINGAKVERQTFISKGLPVIVDGKVIY